MRRLLPVLTLTLLCAGSARAQGVLVPTQADVPPLAMRSHEVRVAVEDQVAVTKVVQTFRNDTDHQLEATYLFPVPKGASVRKFVMWVDGKEVPGELVEADKARQIYTDIVRRTQDPGLLEYVGNNLLRVRVFPVPAHGEQKLAVSFTSVAGSDAGLIEYVYPLRADAKSSRALEKFTLEADLKARHAVQNVYSPTHPITVTRVNDRHARVRIEGRGITLDKDFQLYYTTAGKDVGLTALLHRPERDADGHFMMLISPRADLVRTQEVPRDMVFVLDTSGSMQGRRIAQARSALKYCLKNLGPKDRFGVVQFATTVNKYADNLLPATGRQVAKAQGWVDGLEAVGSTNINDALLAALEMRPSEAGRSFTVVFFTDGQPTMSETNPEQIVRNVLTKNTADTRIFTFSVSDDVNAVLLDQLADKTRSVSTYVRETEDIEAKVSGLYAKISHPVLTNLKLTVGADVTISEVYPPQLPDLFHGSQLVVLGRYRGHGHTAITLSGAVGTERKDFVYEVKFSGKTNGDKAFVEDLWARRKVGYLLDQIRTSGPNQELVDEIVRLAKKHGITTPYTSYLVAPDQPLNVANQPPTANGNFVTSPSAHTQAINGTVNTFGVRAVRPTNAAQQPSQNYYSQSVSAPMPTSRIQFAPDIVSPSMQWAVPAPAVVSAAPLAGPAPANPSGNMLKAGAAADDEQEEEEETESPALDTHSGKLAVDLSVRLSAMRNQSQLGSAKVRQAAGRNCVKLRGVWVDDGFDPKLPVVKLKAQGAAYFRMLERQPQMREVFRLGNRVVWVTPTRTVLVIDSHDGKDSMTDGEIDALFVARK